ncbi:hypothetical protein LOK49_LG11G01434 [Camellia lanceoleosa]|uniref:Uncharacterized protein n=1 Tax=Camellia lanceoleosa TaxID=1840588 RepID=A0ACC0G0Q6_9ERIC|nr:hypothetical protein LOK49_LG11G01434 [Camellia lanceoleosa]
MSVGLVEVSSIVPVSVLGVEVNFIVPVKSHVQVADLEVLVNVEPWYVVLLYYCCFVLPLVMPYSWTLKSITSRSPVIVTFGDWFELGDDSSLGVQNVTKEAHNWPEFSSASGLVELVQLYILVNKNIDKFKKMEQQTRALRLYSGMDGPSSEVKSNSRSS